ncbi:O-linked N-acetylglucosamine transferase family protein [Fodinicurvata sediminis]|uniref:O-linked N-acetylglucosamine transferase family protein n=1 Tax=Fodinicurvata sediminis TaxID=1121832 RepID=UPI0003FC1D82|nr:tetratricopeptide repeat protein [Fodinicurvata sediminis]
MIDQLNTAKDLGCEPSEELRTQTPAAVSKTSLGNLNNDPRELEQRYRYALGLLAEDKPSEAIADLQAIHAIIGDDPALMINLGIALTSAARSEEALPVLRTVVEKTPEDAEAHYRLAEALRLTKAYQEALDEYKKCLLLKPDHISALRNIALWALENRDVETALEYADQACEFYPENHELRLNLGAAREASGDVPGARQAYLDTLSLSPLNLQAARRLVGLELMGYGLQVALEVWQVQVDQNPDDLSALIVFSLLLERSEQKQAALEYLAVLRALVNPEDCEGLCSLAAIYGELDAYGEAEDIYAEAYQLDPNNLEVLKGRARSLSKIARYSSAYRMCQEGLAIEPDNLVLQNLKACSEQHLGWHSQARHFLLDAVFQKEDSGILRSAIGVLPYDFSITPEMLLDVGRKIQTGNRGFVEKVYNNTVDGERPLRIGLLSGCFGKHPVGWLTVAAFEALPKDKFSLHVFSTRRRDDYLNRRFKVNAETWHEYSPHDTMRISHDMLAEGIDILIDLGGYGDGGNPQVLLEKPAPVVVKWVGSQSCSTGLDTIDWMLTDFIETPEGFEKYYTEKLLRLPDGYICYTPPINIQEPRSLPALENGYVTFGCFNNLCKVNDETLELWSRVLKRVPNSRMIVKARTFEEDETSKLFLERFAKYGIEADRLELRGTSPHEEMMRQYADMDIALDPIPYSGGLTTCESLYMGVPVVTVPFRTFASRHSASHMTNVGLADWVAEEGNLEQYVDIAVAKASDIQKLSELRAGLRNQLLASPICDAIRFGGNLGTVLRSAWREWCKNQENNSSVDALSDELASVIDNKVELDSLLISPAHIRRIRDRLGAGHGLFPTTGAGSEEQQALIGDPVLENESNFEFNTFTMEKGPLALLKALFERVKPKTVVEFGSGISTAILARHLIDIHGGDGDISYITIDQSQEYLNEALARAETHATGLVRGKYAPVGDIEAGGRQTQCYQVTQKEWQELLDGRLVDIVIIDGPVGGGPYGVRGARFGTVPMIAPYAANGALFTLDDAFRDTEIEISEQWQDLPGIGVLGYYPLGKGVLIGQFNKA